MFRSWDLSGPPESSSFSPKSSLPMTIGTNRRPFLGFPLLSLLRLVPKKVRLPVFKTIKRDWETEQKAVLLSAEEFELLEHYRLALAERDKLLKKQPTRRFRKERSEGIDWTQDKHENVRPQLL